jgi:Coenzyme PQQ synthesis protein D (PqqD)
VRLLQWPNRGHILRGENGRKENVLPVPSRLGVTDEICWSGQQITADVGGQTVALSFDYANYCGFDEIAGDIWRRIERPVTVASLCADLVQVYDADASTITRDVVVLLERMREQGLIEVANGAAAGRAPIDA